MTEKYSFGASGEYEVEMCGNSGQPCIFEVDQILKNVTIEILRCPVCGKTSIGWFRQADTEEIEEEELYAD